MVGVRQLLSLSENNLKLFFILQPSTAGDVSNSESDEAETAVQDALQIEPVERWRSFSEGEQVQYMWQVFFILWRATLLHLRLQVCCTEFLEETIKI